MKYLENDTKTITPSEINRFSYCPYQWYYERVYGRKELRRLLTERNKWLNYMGKKQAPVKKPDYTNKSLSNFKRGTEYHLEEYRAYQLQQSIIKAVVITAVVAAIAVYLFFRVSSSV